MVTVSTTTSLSTAAFHTDNPYPEVGLNDPITVIIESDMTVNEPTRTTFIKIRMDDEVIHTTPEALKDLVDRVFIHQAMVKSTITPK